jgi:glycosyltransferase involved in cell wall biosynthesis
MKSEILFVTRKYPPIYGGMEKYSYDFYTTLSERTSATLLANKRGNKFLPIFFLKSAWYLAVHGHKYKTIHFGDALLSPLVIIAKWRSSAKVVVTAHGLDVTYANPAYQTMLKRSLKHADLVICVSNYTKDEVRKRAAVRTAVLPNGLRKNAQVRSSAKLERVLGTIKNRKLLISVGRLVPRKGMLWFVRSVMPLLPERYLLVIAGNGPEQEKIVSAIKELGLERKVKLLNKLSEDAKIALYSRGEWFVMPNVRVEGNPEGFGIVLLEAASCGLPALASRVDGIPDAVIEGETGYLLKSRDAKAFAAAILGKKRPKGAAAVVVKKFSWNVIIAQYLKILREAR